MNPLTALYRDRLAGLTGGLLARLLVAWLVLWNPARPIESLARLGELAADWTEGTQAVAAAESAAYLAALTASAHRVPLARVGPFAIPAGLIGDRRERAAARPANRARPGRMVGSDRRRGRPRQRRARRRRMARPGRRVRNLPGGECDRAAQRAARSPDDGPHGPRYPAGRVRFLPRAGRSRLRPGDRRVFRARALPMHGDARDRTMTQ